MHRNPPTVAFILVWQEFDCADEFANGLARVHIRIWTGEGGFQIRHLRPINLCRSWIEAHDFRRGLHCELSFQGGLLRFGGKQLGLERLGAGFDQLFR